VFEKTAKIYIQANMTSSKTNQNSKLFWHGNVASLFIYSFDPKINICCKFKYDFSCKVWIYL